MGKPVGKQNQPIWSFNLENLKCCGTYSDIITEFCIEVVLRSLTQTVPLFFR